MICDTCKEPIQGKSITALGKIFHPDHFVCAACDRPITDSTFHQKDGKPLCKRDYEASCPICARCLKPITDRMVTALDKKFHEVHFVCKMCEAKLAGNEYHENGGEPICHKCFVANVAAKCKACGKAIAASVTVALNSKWHPDCFKCKRCNKAITSHTFKVDNGHPVCETC